MEKEFDNYTDERIRLLEQLVDSLLVEGTDEKLLKSYMQKVGIEYSADPIERMNRVLKALHN